MKLHTVLLILIFAAIAAFAALNWTAFITPTEVSLGLTTVLLPVGVVMLGILAFMTALFLAFVVYLQTSSMFETRRQSRLLQANRELADKAEASRFTDLRTFLEAELQRHETVNADAKIAILARIDQLEHDLRVAIEHTGNTVVATVGELDDRIDRTRALSHSSPVTFDR